MRDELSMYLEREIWSRESTYDYRLVAVRRCCLEGGFAERPDLIKRSQARQIVTEAEAWQHGDWSTCCSATAYSLGGSECF